MIDKLINHIESLNGFYMVLLTFIYVICTFLIWLITKKQINQITKFERERTRPYLVFDMISADHCIFFKLENIGMRPAMNVKVVLDPIPERSDSINIKHSNIINNLIKFIPPGRVIEDFFDSTIKFFNDSDGKPNSEKDVCYEVDLSYEDSEGEKYSEQYSLDLNFQRHILRVDNKSKVDREFEKLNKNISSLRNSLERKLDDLIHKDEESL